MTTGFWFWLVIAAVLFAGEALSRGLYLLPFGAGALAAAVLESLRVDVAWQWAVFVGLSSVTLVLVHRLARPSGRRRPTPAPTIRAPGRAGTVIEGLATDEGRGLVLMDGREWRAYAPGWEPVPEGTPVVIETIGRSYLIVRPADEDAHLAGGA